ncbi:putative transcriptional regulator [Opitutaceae bacterium TAV1]|nr:transcriptional regulator [Opitutaceae bacterium TAV5]EIP98321.1 putative transcriptional regulator [Opitutaceae bacterium TAV1]
MRRIARTLRETQGLTQEEFAEKAQLDYKYYQLFEIGRTGSPSIRMLENLAKVLNLKPWILLCDDIPLVSKLTGISATELTQRIKSKPGRPRKTAD